MALSAKEMGDAIIRNMKEKTGRTADEWIALIPAAAAGDKTKAVAWLKSEHGLGHYQAVTVFQVSEGPSEYEDRGAIEKNLFGDTTDQRAVSYRSLEKTIMSLSDDVQSIACRTYIPFKRKKQFAVIAPSPKGHIRLAIALGDTPLAAPFVAAKGVGGSDRIGHMVELDEKSARTLPPEVRSALETAWRDHS